MFGLALEGLALVSEGKVDDGMRKLDEATAAAIGGEMHNSTAIGSTCCCLIFACERVFDYDRALQWCERLKDYCERISYVPMLGVCRSHYAGVLMWAGAWDQAESELAEAARALQATRPAFLAEAIVRQGFLRYQQGRLDEAVVLFEQVLYFPTAQLGMGRLALDLGEADTALDHAERYLRHIPSENRTERVGGLELMARAHLSLGNLEAAHLALAELTAIAGEVGTGPLLAITRLVAGLLSAGTNDHASARSLLEDAADLFGRSGAPYEMGRARIALAQSLEALGRLPAAEREAQAALLSWRELGAERQAAQAEALLKRLRHPREITSDEAPEPQLLSARQREVLKLIAQGSSDQEIADTLMLSPHTVHRHVTNILARLDVPSRAAAVAYAARQGLI
jgi:DNA-binding CsgD family transcriptional regulator/tetratricopeptide (TPR) repeat protein